VIGDLRNVDFVTRVLEFKGYQGNFYQDIPYKMVDCFDEIYQFAADMGGAGFVFTGEHDADIMHNSVSINLHVLDEVRRMNERLDKYEPEHHPKKQPKIFYSSSACMYPEYNQLEPDNPNCKEDSAYPAAPDSEYGWEKLFSERLYLTFNRNYDIPVRIARYHNVFGPEGTWEGGREKAPAAICRKVAELPSEGGSIEVWGDGLQTRSFLLVDECVEATY
jgi:nucleoside-diphosphate-sugar epimerase